MTEIKICMMALSSKALKNASTFNTSSLPSNAQIRAYSLSPSKLKMPAKLINLAGPYDANLLEFENQVNILGLGEVEAHILWEIYAVDKILEQNRGGTIWFIRPESSESYRPVKIKDSYGPIVDASGFYLGFWISATPSNQSLAKKSVYVAKQGLLQNFHSKKAPSVVEIFDNLSLESGHSGDLT